MGVAPTDKKLIGWKETVDLPDWGIRHIVSKSDTGARRSAIDVSRIVELPGNRVRFDVVLDRRDRSKTRTVEAEIDHQTHVRSSNGEQHERYFVRTRVVISGLTKEVEFSLVSRADMVCRILLGRKALEDDFLVDPSVKHVSRARSKVRVVDDADAESQP